MNNTAKDGTVFEWVGEGPPVVLIHGFGMDRNMWQWQIPDLMPKYRVLTYDLFGHGESPNPPSQPCLTLFSEQIIGLLDQHGISQCALIGFSLGGMIARRFALDHGDRLSGLGILNSPHDRSSEDRASILKRVDQAAEEGPESMVEAALLRWFSEGFRKTKPETMALVRDWILANDATVYSSIYRVLADGDKELVEELGLIDCPTLVMTGEEDFGNSVKMSEEMADMIPKADVIILPKLRHMALAEAPDLVNSHLLSFLEKIQQDK